MFKLWRECFALILCDYVDYAEFAGVKHEWNVGEEDYKEDWADSITQPAMIFDEVFE